MNEIKKEELFFTFDVCMSFSISLTASDPSGVQLFFKKIAKENESNLFPMEVCILSIELHDLEGKC